MQEFANPAKGKEETCSSTMSSDETSSAVYQLLAKFKGKLTETRYKQLKVLLRDVQSVAKCDHNKIQHLCSDLSTLLHSRALSREVEELLKILEPYVASELKTQIKFLQKRL